MFDEVTKREGGKRAARKGAYLFGSTAFQVAFIAALIVASERIRAHVADGPIVDVKFVKTTAPPPPPPPPAPPKRRSAPKPPSDAPKPVPPPPQAMIQPKEVQEEIKLPDPGSKPEPEPDYGGDGDGDGDGVVGGVVGAGGGGIEEAPQYATAGWRPPAMKQRGCVQGGVRIPRELQGYVTTVTVKFGIKPTGEPYAFSVIGAQPDQRIINAIWQAVTGCEWTPGADAQGKPVAIWVLLPLKFQQ